MSEAGLRPGQATASRGARRLALALALVIGAATWPATSQAGSGAISGRYCDPGQPLSAEQKDRIFRFGALVKAELERSGAALALIARSGLDLRRLDARYSHAGISLKASPDTPWAVRQLYYACDEQRPRLFDQGLSAFLMGGDEPSTGYVSIVFMPPEAAAALERAALDNRRSLQLLGADYSANAYPFSVLYQNCNQWLAELLAVAWGGIESGLSLPAHAGAAAHRAQAQRWLQAEGYAPRVFEIGRLLMWAGAFVPFIHSDDHPAADLQAARYRVSMPESIEAFVRARLPGATRVELCHAGDRVVVRQGWEPIADGCVAGAQDRVLALP